MADRPTALSKSRWSRVVRRLRSRPIGPADERHDPLDSFVSEFLDIRTANTLEANGIHTARELAETEPSQLLATANFGERSLKYVQERFQLHMGMIVACSESAA